MLLFPLRRASSLQFCCRLASQTKRQTINPVKSRTIANAIWTCREQTIIVGAVSYCDSVSSIWEGMRQYFLRNGINLDFVLFTSYERQLECLLSGQIDIAWNGPVAHARLQRIVSASVSLGMRDVDRDFVSYILPTKGSGIECVKDLENKRLSAGSFDSPQAYILPMHLLETEKVDLSTIEVTRFDKDIGAMLLLELCWSAESNVDDMHRNRCSLSRSTSCITHHLH